MSQSRFEQLVGEIARDLADRPLDDSMADHLNRTWPADGPAFAELRDLCAAGERDGWLMAHQAGGIRFGRVVKPGTSAGAFSVDVVRMKDIRGPHHIHPNGEIGAVIGLSGTPHFDDFPEGWYVYGPGTDHHPTVTGGDAYVLYLLPEGAIEFTKG
ncbi:MAG: DUF4863 family protein [Qingshengfaniella sp.]